MTSCQQPVETRTNRFGRNALSSTDAARRILQPSESADYASDEVELITVGRAACGLVHDMRNLAFSMSAVLSRMSSGFGKETWSEDVQSMTACVEYLQALAARVARLAEPPKPEQRLDIHTSLHDWWTQAHPLMKLVLPARVKLDCSLQRSDLWVALDPNSMTHAMLNLVHNAGKALLGRDHGCIEIWAAAAEHSVMIGVTDNGPGLAPSIVHQLCPESPVTAERDVSAPIGEPPQAAKAARPGHGLGIVRDIALAAGGELRMRTVPDVGTTFVLVLPGGPEI